MCYRSYRKLIGKSSTQTPLYYMIEKKFTEKQRKNSKMVQRGLGKGDGHIISHHRRLLQSRSSPERSWSLPLSLCLQIFIRIFETFTSFSASSPSSMSKCPDRIIAKWDYGHIPKSENYARELTVIHWKDQIAPLISTPNSGLNREMIVLTVKNGSVHDRGYALGPAPRKCLLQRVPLLDYLSTYSCKLLIN